MRYIYTLEVREEESGEIVGSREMEGSSLIATVLSNDVNKWIENFEKTKTLICTICNTRKHVNEITFRDSDEDNEFPLCQQCAELVINGDKKLPEVEAQDLETGNLPKGGENI